MPAHVETEGIAAAPTTGDPPVVLDRARPRSAKISADKIECSACPVLCLISPGKSGACDRYANDDGVLIRVDPVLILDRRAAEGDVYEVVPFQSGDANPTVDSLTQAVDTDAAQNYFVTGVGASTTYPDYKPAPFIVSSQVDGIDTITVVTEGIFSYCSFRVKIDTDRWLGAEQAPIRCEGETVGHVTTAEYGSQMLSLGGVHHLTGGGKKEGRVSCAMMCALGNKEAVALDVEGGASLVIQAGRPPIVNGVAERRMRVGCGSATIGIFAKQFFGIADEVVVVDDHITGVLTEHQAGRCLDMRPSGIKLLGRKSTPGRYFQVAQPGTGWGGTHLTEALGIIERWDSTLAWSGQRVLLTSTTGEHAEWYVLDDSLRPQRAPMPLEVQAVVNRIAENCEPSLSSVLFVAGAGGSLRAGVTDNPVRLTDAIKRSLVKVSCGGAPAYVWPGGGITVMVDVARMPDRSFGTVPTPAIVAPIEFSMTRADFVDLGGHESHVRTMGEVLARGAGHRDGAPQGRRFAQQPLRNGWPPVNFAWLG